LRAFYARYGMQKKTPDRGQRVLKRNQTGRKEE
jgi:hypothetical protein